MQPDTISIPVLSIDSASDFPLRPLADHFTANRRADARLAAVFDSEIGRELLGCYVDYPSKLRFVRTPGVPLILSSLAVCVAAGITVEVTIGDTQLAMIIGEDHHIASSIYALGRVRSQLAAKS